MDRSGHDVYRRADGTRYAVYQPEELYPTGTKTTYLPNTILLILRKQNGGTIADPEMSMEDDSMEISKKKLRQNTKHGKECKVLLTATGVVLRCLMPSLEASSTS